MTERGSAIRAVHQIADRIGRAAAAVAVERRRLGRAWARVTTTEARPEPEDLRNIPPAAAEAAARLPFRAEYAVSPEFFRGSGDGGAGPRLRATFYAARSAARADGAQRRFLTACVARMLAWMAVVHDWCAPTCLRGRAELAVVLMLSPAEKRFPAPGAPLDRDCVNTAYTYTCATAPRIVIFREEEWLKVFVHECFHAYGLDFSGMDRAPGAATMRELFGAGATGNLFEGYAEAWARLVHCAFCAAERGAKESGAGDLWKKEIAFSCSQMGRVLAHSGQTVGTLLRDGVRRPEATNVVAYFVVAAALMVHGDAFVAWCSRHSPGGAPFQFRAAPAVLDEFRALARAAVTSAEMRRPPPARRMVRTGSLRMCVADTYEAAVREK